VGPPTDLGELRRRVGEDLEAALVGTVRVDEPGPTRSEGRAREMLEETMRRVERKGKALLVTTFSSHLVRIKSIVEISEELGRIPVLVGRSMKNYFSAAAELNLISFPPDLPVYGTPGTIKKFLKKANGSRGDYVLICTGHQGEPTSVLSKIADRKLPFRIEDDDQVIFSASVIPNPINQNHRSLLETKLLVQGARIHRDVHVSGHAARVDTAEFLRAPLPQAPPPLPRHPREAGGHDGAGEGAGIREGEPPPPGKRASPEAGRMSVLEYISRRNPAVERTLLRLLPPRAGAQGAGRGLPPPDKGRGEEAPPLPHPGLLRGGGGGRPRGPWRPPPPSSSSTPSPSSTTTSWTTPPSGGG